MIEKGKNGNGNGKNGHKPDLHKITIVIYQTEDEEKDSIYFNNLMEILKDFRGKDEVHLRIIESNTVTNLRLPNIYIDLTPDLLKRLGQFVKQENLIVDNIPNGKS